MFQDLLVLALVVLGGEITFTLLRKLQAMSFLSRFVSLKILLVFAKVQIKNVTLIKTCLSEIKSMELNDTFCS